MYFVTEIINLKDNPLNPDFLDTSRVEIRSKRLLDPEVAQAIEGGFGTFDEAYLMREYGPFETLEAAREGMARHVGAVRGQAHPQTDFADCNASACALEVYKPGALAPMSVEASQMWARAQCGELISGSMHDNEVTGVALNQSERFKGGGLELCIGTVLDVFFSYRDAGRLEA